MGRRCGARAHGHGRARGAARLLTIAGMVEDPVLRDSAGTTIITAEGVTARFARATVAREGRVVREVLGP